MIRPSEKEPLNEIGEFLKPAPYFRFGAMTDWTLYTHPVPDSKDKVGILTLNTKLGSIDTRTLNELAEIREFLEERDDLAGAILVNATGNAKGGNATHYPLVRT